MLKYDGDLESLGDIERSMIEVYVVDTIAKLYKVAFHPKFENQARGINDIIIVKNQSQIFAFKLSFPTALEEIQQVLF